jgi:hypothetical protein
MNYEPPAIYSLPEVFSMRVRNQGLSVASAIITAEIPAAITAGDTVSTAAFRSYVRQISPAGTGRLTVLALAVVAHATDP